MSNSPESLSEAGSPLRATVSRLARALEKQLSPGDVAALRRLDPDDPAAPAFFKVAVQLLEDVMPDVESAGEPARMEAERRWAAILCAMALTSGLHRFDRPLGSALAESGFAELRLTRLLRARGDQVFPALRAAAQYLASKAEPFDPTDLARLVLSEGRRDEEKVRRAIARSYFKALARNN